MGCWDCNKWEKSPREEIQYRRDQLEYECKRQNMNLRYPWSMYSLSNHITPVLKSATKTMNTLYSWTELTTLLVMKNICETNIANDNKLQSRISGSYRKWKIDGTDTELDVSKDEGDDKQDDISNDKSDEQGESSSIIPSLRAFS